MLLDFCSFFNLFGYVDLSCSTRDLLLWCVDSLVVAYGLISCSAACGISVPPRGIEPKSLAVQGGFLTLDHQGNPWLEYCRREMLKSSGNGERGFYWERRTGVWKKQWRAGRAPILPPAQWGEDERESTWVCSLLHSPHVQRGLTNGKVLINICWVTEW